jgi:hypothetical protein
MGANGSYISPPPPLFIFPRLRMKNELLDGASPGSWIECNENGWIAKEIFVKWLKNFIIWSRATKESPVLLLDGHASSRKRLELINTSIAGENGVILLCFPPYCTHRLQPLNVSFMEKTGLQLAIQKTEAVLLVGRRTAGNIKSTIGIEEIKPKGSVKYLGIRMNQPMTFVLHLEEVAAKAEKMVASLSRIMSMQRVSR